MKRTHDEEEISLIYLDCVPDEIIGKILAFRYPSFDRHIVQTQSVFRLRQFSTRFRKVIDTYLLGGVTKLGKMPLRRLSDDAIVLFTGLRKIYLNAETRISDVGLRKMTGLQKLSLEANVGLKKLSLEANLFITDSSLKTLPKLRKLSILCNLGDIDGSGFCYLTNLNTLNIPHNSVITEDYLSSLSSLTSLNIEDDEMITAEGLLPFKDSLRFINIMGSDIELLDLQSFASLEKVYIDYRANVNGREALESKGVEVIQCCIRGACLY